MPFAYIYNTGIMFISIFLQTTLSDSIKSFMQTLFFIVLGLPVLLVAVAIDTVIFAFNLFRAPEKDYHKKSNSDN